MSDRRRGELDIPVRNRSSRDTASNKTKEADKKPANKKSKKNNKRRNLIIIDVVLASVLLLFLGAYFGGTAYLKWKIKTQIKFEEPTDYTVDPNFIPTEEPTDPPTTEAPTEPNTDETQTGDNPTEPTTEEPTETPTDNLGQVLGGFGGLESFDDLKSYFENVPAVDSNYVTNILLIGTDLRINKPGNGNSDSMILVSINKKTKKIVLTSLMRDMYVYIPDTQYSPNKINYAHNAGGSGFLCKTISGNLKIKVDKYVRVDFFGMIDIIDRLGGIDMTLTEDEVKYANDYVYELIVQSNQDPSTPTIFWENYVFTQPGYQHLSGLRAVAYARIRYTRGDDFKRTERQRAVLMEMIKKLKTLKINEIDSFLNLSLSNVATNMTADEVYNLVSHSLDYLSYEIVTLRLPIDGSYWEVKPDIYSNGRTVSCIGFDIKKNVEKLLDTVYGSDR